MKFDDFKELKIECLAICDNVEIELNANASKLKLLREQLKVGARTINEIFYNYLNLDVVDKKYIVSVIPPTTTNITTGAISIHINSVLAKILSFKKLTAMIEVANLDSRLYSYKERTVPIKQAISVIVRNGIQLDENEAGVILDFLYRMAKTYNFTNASNNKIPKWISNRQKMEQKIS